MAHETKTELIDLYGDTVLISVNDGKDTELWNWEGSVYACPPVLDLLPRNWQSGDGIDDSLLSDNAEEIIRFGFLRSRQQELKRA